MTSFSPSKATLLVALSTALGAQAAPLQNGDFSQGLSAWSISGDVSVVKGSAVGVNLGTAVVLGTASLDFVDDAPAAAGAYNVSGTAATMAGQPAGLEANLGLGSDAYGPYALEGSSLAQSFFVTAGQTISFDWRVLSRDAYAGTGSTDTDSAWLTWTVNGATTQTLLGEVGTLTYSGTTSGWKDTGSHTVSFVATTTGTARLGFSVLDIYDGDGTSLLAVNNIALAPAVPEPDSLVLLLAGLAVAATTQMRGEPRQR
jgi:hypothetical protein